MENQTLNQRKIALAQSEHASVVIEIIRDCLPATPLVTDSEWGTIVNTITLDANSTLMRAVVDRLDSIRNGILHQEQNVK